MSTHGGYSFPGLNTLFGRVHRVSRSLVPSFLRLVPSFRWFRSFVPSFLSFVPYLQIHHIMSMLFNLFSEIILNNLSGSLAFHDGFVFWRQNIFHNTTAVSEMHDISYKVGCTHIWPSAWFRGSCTRCVHQKNP